MKIKQLLLLIMLWSSIGLQAQNSGDQIFNNTVIHEVRISFENENFLNILTSNFDSTIPGGKIAYLMGVVNIDGEDIDSIGVRFKGFTSYSPRQKKNPLKLDFNEFVKGQRYDGLRKLNLNNATGDPAMQRDLICYDILRTSGVAASRVSFSNVYINDEFWGFYQNIEQIDKTFIKENFANKGGNLFKNKGWNNFEYTGQNKNEYSPPYELKTNRSMDDFSGLIDLMKLLNDTMTTDFATEIDKIFNVDLYLKTLAVDVATENWDSNLQHGRNWYMYEDTVTGKFNWIPWDYNFSLSPYFGGFGSDSTGCNLFVFFDNNIIDPVTVSFQNWTFVQSSVTFLWDFGDGQTSTEESPTHIYNDSGIYDVCLTVTASDTCYSQECIEVDTNQPECPVIMNGSCPHPPNEIFNIVVAVDPTCCNEWSQGCEDFYIQLENDFNIGYGTDTTGSGGLTYAIDQSKSGRRLINKLLSVPEYNDRYHSYFCDLLEFNMTEERIFDIIDQNITMIKTAVKADSNFLFTYDQFLDDIGENSDTIGLKSFIKTRIATLNHEIDSLGYCNESTVLNIPWHDIVINEFVASNDSLSGISDASGKYEDWIEIYNNTDVEVDLSDSYLSHKKSKLQEWRFPTGTMLSANDYLIVWADKDEEETDRLHAGFKLKKSGDEIYLSNKNGEMIDSINFENQTTNIPMARRPNGTGYFTVQNATFGSNNDLVATTDIYHALAVLMYPNPVSDQLTIHVGKEDSKIYHIHIFTASGRKVKTIITQSNTYTLDVEQWGDGMYFMEIENRLGALSYHKFIVAH